MPISSLTATVKKFITGTFQREYLDPTDGDARNASPGVGESLLVFIVN